MFKGSDVLYVTYPAVHEEHSAPILVHAWVERVQLIRTANDLRQCWCVVAIKKKKKRIGGDY